MSKISIEPVIFLPYKGKKLPFRVSWMAYKQFVADTGTDFSTISDNPENTEKLVWYGLVAGAKWVNEKIQIEQAEVEMVFDQNYELCQDSIADFFLATLRPLSRMSQQSQVKQ